ncbi:MAG TPA: hypothetical protein DDX19_18580 [Rhodopirellula baltica]|nr:hypothetical protein [Rhodopirellula baltica]
MLGEMSATKELHLEVGAGRPASSDRTESSANDSPQSVQLNRFVARMRSHLRLAKLLRLMALTDGD